MIKGDAYKAGPEGPRMSADFPDGTSNTILIVEADEAHAVSWTKVEDVPYDAEQPSAASAAISIMGVWWG